MPTAPNEPNDLLVHALDALLRPAHAAIPPPPAPPQQPVDAQPLTAAAQAYAAAARDAVDHAAQALGELGQEANALEHELQAQVWLWVGLASAWTPRRGRSAAQTVREQRHTCRCTPTPPLQPVFDRLALCAAPVVPHPRWG